MSGASEYLGITDEEFDELDVELHADSGMSGEMVYGYYFEVPDDISFELLKKTGWNPGEVIRLPAYAVENDNDEFEWVLQSEQNERFNEFCSELNYLEKKTNGMQPWSETIELRMTYSYSVTLFEAFLIETAKYIIANNEIALREAVKYFSSDAGAQKFSLEQILDFNIKKYVLRMTSGLTLHNTRTAEKFLSKLLSQPIDLSSLDDIIRNRHDIIHRNGKTISGDDIKLTPIEINSAITLIKHAATSVHKMVEKLDEPSE